MTSEYQGISNKNCEQRCHAFRPGIMALEMVSSKVQGASDYPLALLIGYGVGKYK